MSSTRYNPAIPSANSVFPAARDAAGLAQAAAPQSRRRSRQHAGRQRAADSRRDAPPACRGGQPASRAGAVTLDGGPAAPVAGWDRVVDSRPAPVLRHRGAPGRVAHHPRNPRARSGFWAWRLPWARRPGRASNSNGAASKPRSYPSAARLRAIVSTPDGGHRRARHRLSGVHRCGRIDRPYRGHRRPRQRGCRWTRGKSARRLRRGGGQGRAPAAPVELCRRPTCPRCRAASNGRCCVSSFRNWPRPGPTGCRSHAIAVSRAPCRAASRGPRRGSPASQDGDYWMRLRGIDDSGLEGRNADFQFPSRPGPSLRSCWGLPITRRSAQARSIYAGPIRPTQARTCSNSRATNRSRRCCAG